MTVVWRASAIADVVRIIEYISKENGIAAREIGRELFLAGDSLIQFPRHGRRGRDPAIRELTTVRPYIIVYEVDEDDNVVILNIWHAAQNRS